MVLDKAISTRIMQLCKERKITPNKLATMANMPAGTLKGIFYGKSKNPGIRTILDLCQALNISLSEFFNDDIFKDNFLEGRD